MARTQLEPVGALLIVCTKAHQVGGIEIAALVPMPGSSVNVQYAEITCQSTEEVRQHPRVQDVLALQPLHECGGAVEFFQTDRFKTGDLVIDARVHCVSSQR